MYNSEKKEIRSYIITMNRLFGNPVAVMLLLFMAYSSFRSGAFNDPKTWLMQELIILPGIIVGLSFHEYAHALAAYKLGDITPKLQNRLTINPAAHIDPVGFIALLFVGFGWGRPVEINPRNFKNMRRDEFIVSIAGVVMNLLLAIVFSVILAVYFRTVGLYWGMGDMKSIIGLVLYYCIYINFVLMVFNLLPIPPLDGFNVVTELFDLRKYDWWYTIYQYGSIILIGLILLNFTDRIMTPILEHLMTLAGLIFMP